MFCSLDILNNRSTKGEQKMTEKIILELLKERNFKEIKNILNDMNEVDIAQLLEQLPERETILAFRLMKKEEAAETFTHLDPKFQKLLIEAFTERELKEVLDELYLDDTVDLLEEMPANVVERILSNTDVQTRSMLNTLLNYPKDSVGSIMTVEYVDFKKTMTVEEAVRKLKRVGIDSETIYTCYVIEGKKLIGTVSAKDLLISDDKKVIEEIMESHIISVTTTDDKEEAAKLIGKYGLLALPVVDKENCMVGIVTVDDAMEVMEDEATEDISRMMAVSPSDDTYFGTSVLQHAKNRIVWLLILMLSATFTGMIISRYENAFSAVPILVSFIPMLMDTGGNCGSQSSTLIIRGLAVDEIGFKDFFRVLFKEFRISLIVSVALAVVNAIRIMIMYQNIQLAILIGLSLVATVIMAKMVGCMLPLLAKKCKLDPAIMAAPLITTLVDTGSILVYFAIATKIFHL